MPRYIYHEGINLDEQELYGMLAPYAPKFYWFSQCGYKPHFWQTLFHSLTNKNRLCRFRHIVAGRRGGKTLSAAWEILYYSLFPHEYFKDAHNREADKPLHTWVLAPDHVIGRASYLTFKEVLEQAKLEYGKDYKENKSQRFIEFRNNSLVEFKTADEPERLRGAGLNMLWIDESAIIPDSKAYDVSRPALSDKQGLVLCTTTPLGKNWYYDTFWNKEALVDPAIGRVEYRSIDNPYFPAEEWQYIQKTYHPLLFQQEYMASFDSLAGKELPGDWLHYYTPSDLPKALKYYVGIDPAISLADTADRFAAVLLGIDPETQNVYLVDLYVDRIPFPEQVKFVADWHAQYRPIMIGIEAQAYQAALVQQAQRLEGIPPIVPMLARGKKSERILSMSPLFKIGKVRIRQDHTSFIEEWLDYDSTVRNPKDDTLDAMEIALRTAGALLPVLPPPKEPDTRPAITLDELAMRDLPGNRAEEDFYDEHLGVDY